MATASKTADRKPATKTKPRGPRPSVRKTPATPRAPEVTQPLEDRIKEAMQPMSKELVIEIEGLTPYVPKQMSRGIIEEMLHKHMVGKTRERTKKVPSILAVDGIHFMDPESVPKIPQNLIDMSAAQCVKDVRLPYLKGVPVGCKAASFRHAMCDAARQIEGIAMTQVKAGLFVNTDNDRNLVEIVSPSTPFMRCDYVRLQDVARTPDVRPRIWYPEWSATLRISYMPTFSIDQIVRLVSIAGDAGGVGEHRRSKGGQNGRFHITGVKY